MGKDQRDQLDRRTLDAINRIAARQSHGIVVVVEIVRVPDKPGVVHVDAALIEGLRTPANYGAIGEVLHAALSAMLVWVNGLMKTNATVMESDGRDADGET